MAKPKSKQQGKTKGKAPDTGSFALSPFWLTAETLLVPVATLLVVYLLLARFASWSDATVEIAIVVALVAIRLPLLVWTLARDSKILLGKDSLHVPIVSVLQLKPVNIPLENLVSIEEKRSLGSAPRIIIVRRRGLKLKFASSVVKDRHGAIKAIERRSEEGREED